MNYPDFFLAAKRHKSFCEKIIEKELFSNIPVDNSSPIVNVYYLSGYIIECSLKYAFFKCSGYETQKPIEGSPQYSNIKTHDLNHLYNQFILQSNKNSSI